MRRRSGNAYDPRVADAFGDCGERLLGELDNGDPWELWLAADPRADGSCVTVDGDAALDVLADFADLKSPFTGGHSRGVAALAHTAAQHAGFSPEQAARLRAAALVHDLGRVAAQAGPPDGLTARELEVLRLVSRALDGRRRRGRVGHGGLRS